jgi:predicted transcriptional regulator
MMSTSAHGVAAPEQKIAALTDLSSPQAKLVYLTLLTKEEVTATELQQLLGLSKLTLLPVLTSLVSKGLIRRTEVGYAC